MTVTAARAAAEHLRVCLLDNGVRRVSLELQPGVGPKADPWGPAPFVRDLGHHIVSRRSMGLTPGLSVVKGGRGEPNPLQGPLANCYGGFDLVARIITLGWANHPGEGGPWPVPGWGTVPVDNGRPYILGWEFEGGIEAWPDEMHDFMARCHAGSLDWLGWLNGREPAPLACHDEHSGWTPRKIDRLGYTTASGRARIAAVRGAPAPERTEDMHLVKTPDGTVWKVTDLDVTPEPNIYRMFALAHARGLTEADIVPVTAAELADNRADADARRARLVAEIAKAAGGDVDEAAVVEGLLPKLTEALAGRAGLTVAAVEQVVRGIFRDAGE